MKKHIYSRITTIFCSLLIIFITFFESAFSFASPVSKRQKLPPELLKEFKEITDQENLAAKYYELGQYKKAFSTYKKIEKYSPNGPDQEKLGYMYQYGLGVEKNTPKAIQYYNMSFRDFFSRKQYVNAFLVSKSSAKLGDIKSQSVIGLMYLFGMGVIENQIKAYAWLSVVKAQGGFSDKQQNAKQLSQFKKELESQFRLQDFSANRPIGTTVAQANHLAEKYYNLYVIHENQSSVSKSKPKNTFLEKFKDAIKIFEQ